MLYFWIDQRAAVLTCLREVHRILRSGGEARIFPVFFGNFHLYDKAIWTFVNAHFQVRVVRPRRYSAEPPWIYMDKEAPRGTAPVTGQLERAMHQKLQSHTLILTKL